MLTIALHASLHLQKSHSSNHLCWKLFYIKNAGCASTMLLQELCHIQFWGNFPKIFRIATLQNSGWVLQISPEIIVTSCFPCFVYFKNMFRSYVLHITWLKIISWSWNKKNLDFNILLYCEIGLTKYVGWFFERCLHFG